jgi:hypothetical protein
VLAIASSSFAASPSGSLVTVDRSAASAQLLEINESGELKFSVPAGSAETVSVPRADLVAWGAPAEFGRGTYVVTIDGGVLSALMVAVAGENLEITGAFSERHSLPLSVVRGIVFNAPAARRARDRLFRLPASPAGGDRDRLLLAGGDEVQGTLTSIDARNASIETSVGPAKIDLNRVTAVVFNPALSAKVEVPAQRLLVGLADGSLYVVPAGKMRLASTGAALHTAFEPAGTEKPWTADRDQVVFLQALGGRSTYLSDLEPSGYKHVPYLELAREYRLDRSPAGGDLRAGGRRYQKGIGMHSTSRLTFPLRADDRKFAAEIAIDDETAGRGSVTFRVFVDAQERFRSDVVRGGDPPKPVEVDVAGGTTLSLVVDFAEDGDVLDHADWLNARLIK